MKELSDYNKESNYKYCIYLNDPKADWVKIGYGNLKRPGSNCYFTSYGHNADCVMYITNLTKEECFELEQGLHKHMKNKFKSGDAGIECYITNKKNSFVEIEREIDRYIDKMKIKITKIKTNVLEIRKTFNIESDLYNIKNITMIDCQKLLNTTIKCKLCGKFSTKLSYECNIVDNNLENEETTIKTGPTCFKKLEKKFLSYSSTFQDVIYKKLTKGKDSVSKFIDEYLIDSRVKAIPIGYPIDINNLYIKNRKPLILRVICHYMFVKQKSFDTELTEEEFNKYELDIGIIDVYYIVSHSEYFETDEFDNDNNKFNIKFIHQELNEKKLLHFFKGLKSVEYKYCEKFDKDTKKLGEEQISSLENSTFISGIPGSGKSFIAKYILKNYEINSCKDILVLSPTYQSLQLLLDEEYIDNNRDKINIKDVDTIKGLVIDAYSENRKDLKNCDVLIIDEFYMMNIFHLYKIKSLIERFNPSCIKIFGDIYQLQCISFKNETCNIMTNLHMLSTKLVINYRAKKYIDECKFLDINKCNFGDLNNIKQKFTTKKYNETEIINRCFIKEHVFLSSTNDTKNEVNNICYKHFKETKCSSCENTIKLKKYHFCSRCIGGIKWLITSKKKFTIFDKGIDYTEIELPKLNKDTKYSNRAYYNQCNEIIYTSENSESNMLYNGQIVTIKQNKNYKFDIDSNGQKIYINDFNDIDISLAFCMTTHKAQGTTYKTVTFIIDREKIQSDLIFTAITRAKNMEQVLILNKTDNNNVEFKSTQFNIDNDNKLDRECNSIYYTIKKKDNDKNYGRSYINIYNDCDEEIIRFVKWMIKDGPKKHRDIFKKCQLYQNS